jgi:hypothetical protein
MIFHSALYFNSNLGPNFKFPGKFVLIDIVHFNTQIPKLIRGNSFVIVQAN